MKKQKNNTPMYVLFFYVPETHVESVKKALFECGAGRFGLYADCAWQTLGTGQFLPLEGSQPFLGEPHQPHRVPEYKVEILCSEAVLESVVAALLSSHPYETPAYGYWKIHCA